MKLLQKTETFGNVNHSWLGSRDGLRSARTVPAKVAAFTAGTHFPDAYFPDGLALAIATSGANVGYAVPVHARASEVKTVTIAGSGLGGVITLTMDGQTTANIAYNATASDVQTALEGLVNIAPGDVTVTGSQGTTGGAVWTLTFGGAWAGLDVPTMTGGATGLTGGGSVTVATTTAGGSGVTDGSDVLAGFIAYPQAVVATDVVIHVPLLDTGRIITANLPIALSAAQRATNTHFRWI